MHNEEKKLIAFAVVENGIEGKITQVANGYLAYDGAGNVFVMRDEEELGDTILQAAKELTDLILNLLAEIKDGQTQISFQMYAGESFPNWLPADIDPAQRKAIISALGNIKPTGYKQSSPNAPRVFLTPKSKMDNDGDGHSIQSQDLEAIRNAVEGKGEVVIKAKRND